MVGVMVVVVRYGAVEASLYFISLCVGIGTRGDVSQGRIRVHVASESHGHYILII